MDYDRCKDLLNNTSINESWKKEVEEKNQRIVQLEQQLKCCENVKNDRTSKNVETQTKTYKNYNPDAKNRRIIALKRQVIALSNSLKNHTKKTTESSEKGDDKTNEKAEETWKQEMEMKNRRIVELEQEMALLENLLRENVDAQILHDLEKMMDGRSRRIEELEDAIKELEGFLKEDVKEMRDLRYQISLDKERIVALEKCIQKYSLTNAGIDKTRIIELEEMVTSLEDYVREHDVDGLKRKLQDRECRIDQLENQIIDLNKKLLRFKESQSIGDTSKKNNNRMTWELKKEEQIKDMRHVISKENKKIRECELQIIEQQDENLKMELREKEQKMKEMGYDILEKENKIQKYEQQIAEQQNKLLKMEKKMVELEKELYMIEDIDALKETIKIKNERVQELEMEVNSLETSLGERIDVAIEELIAVLKEKEEIEVRLKEDLTNKERKIEELDAALRQSIGITDETERKFKHEKKLRKEADQRITDLEKKIAVMHAASAMKCITCKPLLYKIFKSEEKLLQSNQEKTGQLQELHQTNGVFQINSGQQFDLDKREALKLALSEKDAHLALLEHSGIKTLTQADQAKKLKADKKVLLDRLREEDERSINLDFNLETIPQLIEKISDDNDNNNNNSFDDRPSKNNSPRPTTMNDSSPISTTTSCEHSTKGSMVFDMKDREDKSQIHQQDAR